MENENQGKDSAYDAYEDQDRELEEMLGNNKKTNSAAEAVRSSSVGKGRPVVEQTNVKHKRNTSLMSKVKRTAAAVLIIYVVATSIYGTAVGIHTIKDKIEYTKDLKTAQGILEENSVQRLLRMGLAAITKDGVFVILQNNIEDYMELGLSDSTEILAMRDLINDDEEFEKFIQACNYYDEEGNFCYYTSVDQFLRVNGYTDTKTGAPSQKVWENYAENSAVENYRNGELLPITPDSIANNNVSGRRI